MTSTKASLLPDGGILQPTDIVYGVRAGVSSRFTSPVMPTARDYGAIADGTTTSGNKLQDYIDALASEFGTSARVFKPGRQPDDGFFAISNQLTFSGSNWLVDFDNMLIDASAIGHVGSLSCFYFLGGTADTTTATADIAVGATSVTVADSAGFAAGDLVLISSNTEYFSGVSGVAGFGLTYKQEICMVRSTAANTINLVSGTADSYATASGTITLTRIQQNKNIHVDNIRLYGGGILADIDNGVGLNGIKFRHVQNVSVGGNASIVGFQNAAVRFERYLKARVIGGYQEGIEFRNDTRWCYGTVFGTGKSGSIVGTQGYGLRRLADTEAFQIPRDFVFANTISQNCTHAVGTHTGDRGEIVNNIAVDGISAGIVSRAHNMLIANNKVICQVDQNPAIIVGVFTGSTAHGNVNLGEQIITGNFLRARSRVVSVEMRCNYRIHNNNLAFYQPTGNADTVLFVRAPYADNFHIKNNEINGAGGIGTVEGIGYRFADNNPMTFCKNGALSNNVIRNVNRGISLHGTNDAANPLDFISTADNEFFNISGSNNALVRILDASNTFSGDNIVIGAQRQFGSAAVTFTPPDPSRIRSAAVLNQIVSQPLNVALTDKAKYGITRASTSQTHPAKTTVLQGAIVINTSGSASITSQWKCTLSGTEGTLTGYNAATTSGSPVITLDTAPSTNVSVGMILNVTAAGITGARVQSISGNAVTLDANATSTEAAAAVAYRNPTYQKVPDYVAV